jgi:hypothetical protein
MAIPSSPVHYANKLLLGVFRQSTDRQRVMRSGDGRLVHECHSAGLGMPRNMVIIRYLFRLFVLQGCSGHAATVARRSAIR